MAKSRSRRKRQQAAEANHTVVTAQAVNDGTNAARDSITGGEILASSPSYIRELAEALPREREGGAESEPVLLPTDSRPAATDVAPTAAASGGESREHAKVDDDRTSSLPPAAVMAEAANEVDAPDAPDAIDAFESDAILASDYARGSVETPSPTEDDDLARLERRLAGGRGTNRSVRQALLAIGVVAVAVIGSRAAVRGSSHVLASSVGTIAMARTVKPEKPAAPSVVAPSESPVVAAPAPAAVPAAESVAPVNAEAALESDPVPQQPTEVLATLLRHAVEARDRGVLASTAAMLAWIDAGGHDAQAVAQFAYWLGRRGNLQLAEQWAERATVIDPQNQTAWYVLGATRLDDPTARRADVATALRRCAELPGPFGAECRGPLSAGGSLR